jgi:hypothetical protein
MINDILFFLEPIYIHAGIFSKNMNIFYISISDLNIFSEKKTNLGLFYLKQTLNLHLFCMV